jgi:hypothetical protein
MESEPCPSTRTAGVRDQRERDQFRRCTPCRCRRPGGGSGLDPTGGENRNPCRVTDLTITGPGGEPPVRLEAHQRAAVATLVYFFGGGWVLADRPPMAMPGWPTRPARDRRSATGWPRSIPSRRRWTTVTGALGRRARARSARPGPARSRVAGTWPRGGAAQPTARRWSASFSLSQHRPTGRRRSLRSRRSPVQPPLGRLVPPAPPGRSRRRGQPLASRCGPRPAGHRRRSSSRRV